MTFHVEHPIELAVVMLCLLYLPVSAVHPFVSQSRIMPWNPLETCTPEQLDKLNAYQALLLGYNKRLNLVSRDSEVYFEERHLLHSLALTHRAFPASCRVVDWGTGGGLPVIPLAIRFPGVEFHAVDAIGKKVQAVTAIARRLDLHNLHPWQGRAEEWPGKTDYSVSRATAPLADTWGWHLAARENRAVEPDASYWNPGLICLKGGDLSSERQGLLGRYPDVSVEILPLEDLLGRPYFADKFILHVR